MAYPRLADFLAELEEDGQLVRIAAEVDADLEVAAITDRISKTSGGGPALLFEQVRGHTWPVVTNLFGHEHRLLRALQAPSLDAVGQRVAELLRPDIPESWLEAVHLVPRITQLMRVPPRTVSEGLCQQVVHMGRDVDLDRLPLPRCWPNDAGRSLTGAAVISVDPDTGARCVSRPPLQLTAKNRVAVHWTPHERAWRLLERYAELGRQMPVAIAVGGEPAFMLASGLPLPPGADACYLAGILAGQPLELVRCRTLELAVPAQAECIIEGHIDATAERAVCGPLGTTTGWYSLPRACPEIHVGALTQQTNPVLPVMIPGPPPSEASRLVGLGERMWLPVVRLILPEIVDWHWPQSGSGRHLLFVSLRKRYPGHGRKLLHALWGLDGIALVRTIVVVDEDVNVHDTERVWHEVVCNVDYGRDLVFCDGPADDDDHATPQRGLGRKLGIDATRKTAEEGHPRPWPDRLAMPAELQKRLRERWNEYGFFGLEEFGR